jgi:probable lipoprotein NlpC
MMGWSNAYVGIPFAEHGRTREGCDCWGLVRLVYGDRAILLPSYAEGYATTLERAEIAALIAGAAGAAPWRPVPLEGMADLDILVFRRGLHDAHVGLAVAPGRMLHVTGGQAARLDRIDDGRWRPRLAGVFRHEAL